MDLAKQIIDYLNPLRYLHSTINCEQTEEHTATHIARHFEELLLSKQGKTFVTEGWKRGEAATKAHHEQQF